MFFRMACSIECLLTLTVFSLGLIRNRETKVGISKGAINNGLK